MNILRVAAVLFMALVPVAITGTDAIGAEALLLEAAGKSPRSFTGTFTSSLTQPLNGHQAIVFDVKIPERGLSLKLVFRLNEQADLSVIHFVDAIFTTDRTFPARSIKDLRGILMSTDTLTRGEPVIGAAAEVVMNEFVFGLNVADQANNIELITGRRALHLALVYENDTRALLALDLDIETIAALREFFAQPLLAPIADAENAQKANVKSKTDR